MNVKTKYLLGSCFINNASSVRASIRMRILFNFTWDSVLVFI
jgi:hypothetical protein